MLESQGFQGQAQGQQPPINPEAFMVEQGRMEPSNPDNTPDKERVAMVYRFFNESKSSNIRKEALEYWKQADRLLKGKHSLDNMDADMLDEFDYNFQINKIFSTNEKIVSLLMENLAETEILPRQENQHLLAEALDNFFKHEWERNNWNLTLGTVLKQAIAHRVGWLKVYWDIHADRGRGSVAIEPISNYDLFLHEDAMIRNGELVSKYIIHRMDKTRNQIIGQWRVDPSGEFQATVGMENTSKPYTGTFLDGVRGEAAASLGMSGLGSDDSRRPGYQMKKDPYEVLECHYLDDQLVPSQGYDELPDPDLMYPNGRIIIVSNGHQLHDGPNRNGFCMFVPLTTDPDIETIYGPSIINHLADPQMALNKGFSQIFAHADLCSDPILAISQLSQALNQDSDFRKSGSQIIISSHEDMPAWLTPPPLGDEVYSMVTFSVECIEDVSGVHEIAQGDPSTNARSGVAIDKLSAQGQTRSNLRSDFLDQGMLTLVRNICSLFIDYVEDDRQYRFLDEDSMLEQFGTFNGTELAFPSREELIMQYQEHIEKLVEELVMLQQYDPVRAFQMQNMYMQEIQALEDKIRQTALLPAHDIVSLDIRVQTGTRSMTKSFLMNTCLVLFEYGILPEQSVLKTLDFPGWRNALRQKYEQQQAMAEAEELAIEKQFDLEKMMKEVEHANSMELEELEGAFKIIVARIQALAAEKRAKQSAQKSATKT